MTKSTGERSLTDVQAEARRERKSEDKKITREKKIGLSARRGRCRSPSTRRSGLTAARASWVSRWQATSSGSSPTTVAKSSANAGAANKRHKQMRGTCARFRHTPGRALFCSRRRLRRGRRSGRFTTRQKMPHRVTRHHSEEAHRRESTVWIHLRGSTIGCARKTRFGLVFSDTAFGKPVSEPKL